LTMLAAVSQTPLLQTPLLAKSAPVNTSLLAQPGTVAFLVVFGMGVILFFVFRSMSKHLRKINDAARAEAETAAKTAVGSAQNGSASLG
jgi:hypothetical protein